MKRQSGIGSVAFLLVFVLLSALACAPRKWQPDIHFVPTPQDVVEVMLRLATVNEGDVVYDLGCGDGRFVITAAKEFGALGVGVDIDPMRVKESTRNAGRMGVLDRVTFIQGDLFETPIREATVVTLYLYSDLNLKLRPKLLSELRPGSRVVSYFFDMGDWKPDKTEERRNRIYCWIIPAKIAGMWRWSFEGPEREAPYRLYLVQKYQEMDGYLLFEGKRAELVNPKLEGDQVSFEVLPGSFGWHSVGMRFKGRVSGDVIAGHVDIEGGPLKGTKTWNAARAGSTE